MIIRVLPTLNCRQQWIDFCRREIPYCFVEQPECLIDFQGTHLQITVLAGLAAGHQAIKYSLGSRKSVEPAWSLIRACEWNLERLVAGLEEMDFSSNVRDNSLLGVHTDLTARKFFAKDRTILPPSRTGVLQPLSQAPAIWSGENLLCLIANRQYHDLRNAQLALPGTGTKNSTGGLPTPSIQGLRLQLLERPQDWIGQSHQGRLYLYHKQQPYVSLIPDFSAPAPRLKPDTEERGLF